MLNEDKIKANYAKLVSSLEGVGIDPTSLLDYYGVDLVKAPASTNTDMYRSYEGGLVEHILAVTKNAVNFNETLDADVKVDRNSLIKVALLHQISLAKAFVPNESNWHRERGINYTFNNDRVSMSTGERSLNEATLHGITFTDKEAQAMFNYTKTDDPQSKFFTELLGEIIKSANTIAIKTFAIKNKK